MIVLRCGKPKFISLSVSPPIYRSKSAKWQLCTKNGPKYNNFHANCTNIFMLRFCVFLNPEAEIMLNMLFNTLLKITPHNTCNRQKTRRRKERTTYGPSRRYSP